MSQDFQKFILGRPEENLPLGVAGPTQEVSPKPLDKTQGELP